MRPKHPVEWVFVIVIVALVIGFATAILTG